MKPILRWLLIKGFIASCFYFGITGGNGLAHLAQAIIWLLFFFLLGFTLLCLPETEAAKELRAKFNSKDDGVWHMPPWFNLIYDLTLSVFIAYHSYVFTSLAILGMRFIARVLHDRIKQDAVPPVPSPTS